MINGIDPTSANQPNVLVWTIFLVNECLVDLRQDIPTLGHFTEHCVFAVQVVNV